MPDGNFGGLGLQPQEDHKPDAGANESPYSLEGKSGHAPMSGLSEEIIMCAVG